MSNFEYKAVPAPTQGTKSKGLKSTEDRFALTVTELLNEMAMDGWHFLRAETLPCDERRGLAGTQTTFQNLLVFRRVIHASAARNDTLPPLSLGQSQSEHIPSLGSARRDA